MREREALFTNLDRNEEIWNVILKPFNNISSAAFSHTYKVVFGNAQNTVSLSTRNKHLLKLCIFRLALVLGIM